MVDIKSNNYNTPVASIVAQFTVFTKPSKLSKLLNTLENNKLNIFAFTIEENDDYSTFKFVIGQLSNQSLNDLNLTRNILKQFNLKFEESKAIRFFPPQNKIMLASQYSELIKTLSVYNAYLGENGSIIYETCCPTKTLKILNQLN